MAETTDIIDDPLPPDIRNQLTDMLQPSETIQFSTTSDIRLDGTFGESWLLATDLQFLSFGLNAGAVSDIVQLPMQEITGIEVKDLVGSGQLKARTANEGATLARFSKGLNPKFNDVAKKLETLVKEAQPDLEDEKVLRGRLGRTAAGKRCDACGTVIHHRSGVCPNCLETRKLLTRLLSYAKPHWKLGVISLFLLLTATFIGLLPPLLMRELIDNVLEPASDPFFIKEDGYAQLYMLVGMFFMINLSSSVLSAIRSYILSKLGQHVTYDLRNQVYQHLHRHSLSFYNERETGRIMASITQDVGRLQDFISDGLQEVIRDILTIVIICVILFSMNPKLAALTLLSTPLLVYTTLKFSERFHSTYRGLWRRWAGISALLADTIPGVRVVKAFTQEDREVEKFETRSKELLEGEVRVAGIRSVFSPIMAFITSISTLVIWFVGGGSVIEQTLTLGNFVAFTQYMYRYYGPVQSLCRLNHRFQRASTSAERVFEVLDTQPDVIDQPNVIKLPRIEGKVEFQDVTFSYEPGKPVLQDLSFTIEAGEMIGLAGHSGAGKSTLINLICRFYDIESGKILIDGHDLQDVSLKSLRDQIGVVLQDPFLFNAPMVENIAYGKPDASLAEIVAAAKTANAHDFILRLPDGYDTPVGERGVRLSGGERQRISIARAILRDPRILILDEATSSMDTETEAQIQEALHRLIQGRTTFAIAHRLSTLKHANRLLIIENGELAEIGSHDELIAQDGIYARLCHMQTELSQIRAL
ncbi:MAG: ATP-binding cassette domain-containing protein [Candidatus Latescibacteria bacterium]|nr:ATP-binding cassette domain-containing protein [Candidatus Latescibacterota bacterium]